MRTLAKTRGEERKKIHKSITGGEIVTMKGTLITEVVL